MSSLGSDTDETLPAVDERLVAPNSRYEIDDGKLVYVPPSDPPHAFANANLAVLLGAHVAPEFRVAIDMLTRTSRIDDIAPDASVLPRAPHPETGGRQLEHLAFEVAATQPLSDAGRKAAKLVGRGVRRVFVIDLERIRVLEWSRELAGWNVLDPNACIDDPVLAVPLPVAAMLEVADVDAAVAHALIARRQPILEAKLEAIRIEGRIEGKIEGKIEGLITAVLAVLSARGLAIESRQRERIVGERDPDRLSRWVAMAARCTSTSELIAS